MTPPDKLKTVIRSYFAGHPDGHLVIAAMNEAMKYLGGTRKDGVTPEWYHQAEICAWMMMHEATLGELFIPVCCTVWLHDQLEDNRYPPEVLARFGETVAFSVPLLSKQTVDRPKKTNADYYADMSCDRCASMVKGGDRINNLHSMHGVFGHDKQRAYVKETMELIIPMLKDARNRFPEYRMMYEILKWTLEEQCRLITHTLDAVEAGQRSRDSGEKSKA